MKNVSGTGVSVEAVDATTLPPERPLRAIDLYPLDKYPPLKGLYERPRDFDTQMMDAVRPES